MGENQTCNHVKDWAEMDPGVPPLQQTCQLLALEARTFCNESKGKKSEDRTVLLLFLV